ncbi:MAG TPA: hypothetical protein VL688_03485 [Verrucomicrobiae bacterium]|nr:hypothetical protein [Verrucomicrobiae bacterium]
MNQRMLWQERIAVLKKILTQFFLEAPPNAFNLAVFRIVFFYGLFHYANFNMAWMVNLTRAMMIPPPGYESWYRHIPVSMTLALSAKHLMLLGCLLGCVGLWSRTSAALVFFAGLYALGLPCFFGKINHYQHLLWFPSILAVSHSGDALSVDALLRTIKRVRQNTAPPEDPPDALPALRCIGVILGLIYFFPGFWKLWDSGWPWIFSDNLSYLMRRMWYLYDYVPAFRMDLYPLLYKTGGFLAVCFELSAAFLAMFPPLYPLLVVGGLTFHAMTKAFFAIDFGSLAICYVVFVNWAWIPKFIRKKFSLGAEPRPAPRRVTPAVCAVLFVGAVWIAGELYCGPRKLATWPVGVYPLFDYMSSEEAAVVTVGFEDRRGQVDFRNFKRIYPHFTTPNRWLLELKLLGENTNTARPIDVAVDLARVALRDFPQLAGSAVSVNFYRDRIRLDPDLKFDLLPGRQLIVKIPLASIREEERKLAAASEAAASNQANATHAKYQTL